jgi:hypothetical protein
MDGLTQARSVSNPVVSEDPIGVANTPQLDESGELAPPVR